MLVTLYPPNILLAPSASEYDIEGDIKFGSIYKINMYSISLFQVGNNVSFAFTDARLVTEGVTQYYLIDEAKLLFKEDAAP